MSKNNINSFTDELIEVKNLNSEIIDIKNKSENALNNQSNTDKNFIDKNKSKIIFFYSKYKYLCCKYGVEKIRKNRIDVIVKKVKIKIFKGIHEILKYCLNIHQINRLPQHFIINIRIEFNQQYLDKTIEEIYLKFLVLPSLDEMIQNESIHKDKIEIFTIFMKSKLKEIIKAYLLSDLFILDKKKMEKKSGISDAILFEFVANNICDYFLYGNTANIETIVSEKDSFINNEELHSENKNKIQNEINNQ